MNKDIKQVGPRNREHDLAKNIGKIVGESTGLPVHYIDNTIPKAVFNSLKDSGEFKKYLSGFSDDELYRELSDFWTNFYLFSKPEDRNQGSFLRKIAEFIESLGKDRKYKAYLFIPGIYKFPEIELGNNFRVVNYSSIQNNKDIKNHVDRIAKKFVDVKVDDVARGLWIDFDLYTPHSLEVVKYLKEAVQSYLGAISLLCFAFPIKLDQIFGIVFEEKRCRFIEPQYSNDGRIRNGWCHFANDIESIKEYLNLVASIFSKTKKTQVENKLLLFAKLFILSYQSDSLEIKLVVLISALETLLLADYDQYYIGEKTAEKTALILGKTYNERIKIYKFIKSQYSARSNFVHKGESNIKEQSINELNNLCQRAFFKVLEYSKTYSYITGENGIDSIFIKMKFNDLK